MYGPQSTENGRSAMRRDEDMGIIPRVIGDIFEISNNLEILSLSVYCSFVQIYNENLYDMLRCDKRKQILHFFMHSAHYIPLHHIISVHHNTHISLH